MTTKRSSSGRGKRGTTRPDTARAGSSDPVSVKSQGAPDKESGRADNPEGAGRPWRSNWAPPTRARILSEDERKEVVNAATPLLRVELVHDWLVRGWYIKGRTDKQLAELWGVSRSTVWGYSAEANRLLARELTSQTKEQLLAQLLARVDAVGQDALERTEEVVTVAGEVVEVRRPDHRTALRALEAEGELLGLKVQRHQHTHTVEQLTTEQIYEQLRQHGYQVTPPALEATGETVTERETAPNGEDG